MTATPFERPKPDSTAAAIAAGTSYREPRQDGRLTTGSTADHRRTAIREGLVAAGLRENVDASTLLRALRAVGNMPVAEAVQQVQEWSPSWFAAPATRGPSSAEQLMDRVHVDHERYEGRA